MFPALLAFASCEALRASGLADLGRSEEALASHAAALGWTREAAWRALALLPFARKLTLLILLVCPGAPLSHYQTYLAVDMHMRASFAMQGCMGRRSASQQGTTRQLLVRHGR